MLLQSNWADWPFSIGQFCFFQAWREHTELAQRRSMVTWRETWPESGLSEPFCRSFSFSAAEMRKAVIMAIQDHWKLCRLVKICTRISNSFCRKAFKLAIKYPDKWIRWTKTTTIVFEPSDMFKVGIFCLILPQIISEILWIAEMVHLFPRLFCR